MKIKTSLIAGLASLCCLSSIAQTTPKKTIEAKRATAPIKLDGLIDEAAWKDAPLLTD